MIKQAKPIIFGTVIIVIGFHLSMTALHGLTVFWIDSLQNAGFEGTVEDQVQYINDRVWYAYPRLLFYVCLAATWFLGGFSAVSWLLEKLDQIEWQPHLFAELSQAYIFILTGGH